VLIWLGIIALVGGSVGLLTYALAPPGVDRYYRVQVGRADSAARELDLLYAPISKRKLLFFYLALPPILGILGFVVGKIIGLVICLGLGMAIIPISIKQKGSKRRRLLTSQLIDGLMMLSSSLKAGLSITQAMETLVEEMPPPISQEFGYVLKEVRMGASLDEALHHLKERLNLEDVDLVVTTLLVARDSGGNLTEVFSRLVSVMRERQKLTNKVRVLCTQAKLQGIIMSLLPVAFGLFLFLKNPQFLAVVLEDDRGRMFLIGAFFWWLIGLFFVRRFSRVEV